MCDPQIVENIFEPESSFRLRVFAYFNEYPTCKLWLNPDPMVSSPSSMHPPEKKQSIDLTLWYEQLMQSQLDGIEIVDVDGELAIDINDTSQIHSR